MKPRILDLFAGAGGAAAGYHRAGFEVVGIDIELQPNYPFKFFKGDALRTLDILYSGGGLQAGVYGVEWAAIHASPPCQFTSRAQRIQGNDHPDLIAEVRERLERLDLPYIIENVEGAPLYDPVMLCGTMVGLPLYRHRLFETNWPLTQPLHADHWLPQVKMGRKPGPNEIIQPVGNFSGVEEGRRAMEMPWASRDEIREAIPPAMTELVGHQLMQHINATRKAAA